ncbi:class I SAM-dependent methyltransferase [Candidatus Bathyarchaeota archaeon]|nr:class I SAM-dependent methyltransferase [Candidatus Bathyarchaeota archaeon]
MVAKDLDVYDRGRFAAYLLALRRVIALPSAIGHELIIVDFGCSSGRLDGIIEAFVPNALILGLDLDPNSLRLAHKASIDNAVLADIRRAPVKNSIVDLALCLEVIEHMPKTDALRTLTSIRKMLKTKGFLLLSTPNRKSPTYITETIAHLALGQRYKGGDPTHVNIYSQKEITELLRVSGLDVIANLGYWILPLTFHWINTASSKRNSSKWLQRLLTYTMKLTNPILLKAPSLGFVQILLCTNLKRRQG